MSASTLALIFVGTLTYAAFVMVLAESQILKEKPYPKYLRRLILAFAPFYFLCGLVYVIALTFIGYFNDLRAFKK